MAFDRTDNREPAQEEDDSSFRLADVVEIARERRGLILRITFAVVAVTTVVLFLMPTLYSSTAVVMLDQRRNNVADQSSVLSALPTDPASVQNQIQILTSRDIAERVIASLKLYNDPEFASKPGLLSMLMGEPDAATQLDTIIDNFMSHLWVESEGLSTSIAITFTSKDAHKAARIANAIAQAYIDDQIDTKSQAGRVATQWLEDRISQLARQVQAADAEAERYRAENNLNATTNGGTIVDQQLGAINTQLVQARTLLAEKQALYARVQALVRTGHGADVAQVVASPLIVQLRTQEADLISQQAQLATKYGPKHPKMLAIESQQRDLEAKLAVEISRIAGSMANDVAVAQAQVQSLESSLRSTEGQSTDQNMAMVKLRALQASATSTRTQYEAFVSRLRQAQDQGAIQTADARVISPAPVPAKPSSPKRALIIGASIPAGLLLGLLIALVLARFSSKEAVRVVQKVVDYFRGRPVIAEIPDARDMRAATAVLDAPWSPFTSGVNALLQRLSQSSGQPRVLAVTSAQSGEGATNIAVALARAASRAGRKVALIDGNLQWAEAARVIGLPPSQVGLADVLEGRLALSRSFQRDPKSYALVLSGSPRGIDAGALFSSPPMADLIRHLKQSCDLVIIDAPAVFAAPEARAIAPLCDATLMVVAEPRAVVGEAIGELTAARAAPIGIVLAR